MYVAFQDQIHPDDWRVEGIGSDGEVYVTIFSGPDVEQRAREYAYWQNTKDTPFLFERQVRSKVASLDGTEEVTLECGHVSVYMTPTSKFQTRLPCTECLHEWMEKQKQEQANTPS
jgi:hypothetical protein